MKYPTGVENHGGKLRISLMFTSESMAEQKNINAPLFFNLKCQRE